MNPALIFQYTVLIFLGLAGLITALLNLSIYIDLLEKKERENEKH